MKTTMSATEIIPTIESVLCRSSDYFSTGSVSHVIGQLVAVVGTNATMIGDEVVIVGEANQHTGTCRAIVLARDGRIDDYYDFRPCLESFTTA